MATQVIAKDYNISVYRHFAQMWLLHAATPLLSSPEVLWMPCKAGQG